MTCELTLAAYGEVSPPGRLDVDRHACDTSPYAAKVNSQVIKQTALNVELRAWAGNSAYVSAFNSPTRPRRVTVAGDAPGTYNTTWVASILDGMVDATVVRQRVVATDQPPTVATLAAARSVNEISQVGWAGLLARVPGRAGHPARRRGRPHPGVGPGSHPARASTTSTSRTSSCRSARSASSAFSAGQAASIAAQGVPNGVSACYNQVQFEAQPDGLPDRRAGPGGRQGVGPDQDQLRLPGGQGGQPDRAGLHARICSGSCPLAIVSGAGSANPVVTGLLAKATVRINPAYGTWPSSQVVPPVAPSAGT